MTTKLAPGKWAGSFGTFVLKMIPNFDKLGGVPRIESRECTPYQSRSAIAQDFGLSKTHVLEVLKKRP
jgi:hypothetical protein